MSIPVAPSDVMGPLRAVAATRLDDWLFEVAQRHPEAIAVEHRDVRVTYRELDERADAIAERVIASGIEPGRRIAVCMERTDHLPVALIAVWKAGCAYLPISPDHPAKRRDSVIETAGPDLWLIDEASRASLPPGARFISCDEAPAAPAPWRGRVRRHGSEAESIAYSIFTSGSTGVPKGVDITHRSAANFLQGMQDKPGLDRSGVVLAISTPTFDISVLEIFLPLTVGARVVMVPQEEVRDVFALAERVASGKATLLQGTPTTWRLLLDAGFRSRPGLAMLCGGEPLTRALADRLLEGGGALWNMYGPTETTVWASAGQVLPDDGAISVGKPIANVSFHVVDDEDRPVPRGVQGRLVIGGAGVSRGYIGEPRLTEAAFFEDPRHPGRILYRTGDRATVHPDGRTFLSGRDDRQVKMRGFRIELGEIEAAMEACGLHLPAAVFQKGARGPDRIVGFYQRTDAARDPRALRADMLERLPDYMVPAAFVALADMPKGSSGKTDLRALAAGLQSGAFEALQSARPGPAVEDRADGRSAPDLAAHQLRARLSADVAEILGLSTIGAGDDIFDLGATSLQAFELVMRIRGAFDVPAGVDILMRNPSIEALARWIEVQWHAARAGGQETGGTTPQRTETRTPIFGLHDTILFREMVALLGPDQPFFFVPEPAGVRNADLTYPEIAALYLADVKKARPTGPYAFIGFCFAGRLACEVARQAKAAGDEVELVVAVDTWGPGTGLMPTRVGAALQASAYHFHRMAAHLSWLFSEGFDGLRKLPKRSDAVGRLVGLMRDALDRLRGRDAAPGDKTAQLIDIINRSCQRHVHLPYEGDVLVLHGDACPKSVFIEPTFGWGGSVLGALRIHRIKGEHLDIWKGSSLAEMSTTIAETLAGRPSPSLASRRIVLSEHIDPVPTPY